MNALYIFQYTRLMIFVDIKQKPKFFLLAIFSWSNEKGKNHLVNIEESVLSNSTFVAWVRSSSLIGANVSLRPGN